MRKLNQTVTEDDLKDMISVVDTKLRRENKF